MMKNFLLFSLVILSSVFSAGNPEDVYGHAEANNFLLPLDAQENHHILVEIPDHFVYANYEREKNKITMQFIPKGEKLKKWSQIITILVFPPEDNFKEALPPLIDSIPTPDDPTIQFDALEHVETGVFSYEIPDSRGKPGKYEVYHGKGYHGEETTYIVFYAYRHNAQTSIRAKEKLEKASSSFIKRLRIVSLQ